MRWDPVQYLQFADERGRPFSDLMRRVAAQHPATVVDLGCGPGNLTRDLARRWPDAQVLGVDSSPEMIEQAQAQAEGVAFELGDLREWSAAEPVDVLVSNATLQWLPGHLALLPRLVSQVADGGWFAFQVPGNFGEPSHSAIAELVTQPPWRSLLDGVAVARPQSEEPATYLEALVDAGCVADVWETTYLQVLPGPDAVLRWMTGTGLRPVLGALGEADGEEFLAAYRERISAAYPEHPWGTVLPYRRIFAVAQKRQR